MKTEVWKDIEGYPGYQVSNYGQVRSYNKVTSSARFEKRMWKDRIIKQKIGKDKCCRVSLWANGKENTVLVHRLVANEFCGKNIKTNLTVNHKDGNRLNNNADNLEWMSREDNIRYGFENDQYTTQKKQMVMDDSGNCYKFNSLAKLNKFLGRSNTYTTYRSKRHTDLYSSDGKRYTIIMR